MIKNIVFDMGNVLLDFKPEIFMTKMTDDKTVQKTVLNALFHSKEWQYFDKGTITENEIFECVAQKIPEHNVVLKQTLQNWFLHFLPIDGMFELVQELKYAGYSLFILSNASKQFHIYSQNAPIFQLFDKFLISADVKLLKPQAEIYELLLERNNLKADECLFIDDLKVNVEGAISVGMNGKVFIGKEDLREFLRVDCKINIK